MDPKFKFNTIDEYHEAFPPDTRKKLDEMRKTIQLAAPKAKEVISYNMPAFKQHGVLVYYAGYNEHIGFYPTASPIEVFKEDLKSYKTSKGAIQFPLDKPIPTALVKKITRFRIEEDEEYARIKALRKKK
jgi:uncharacterized protein YdhG (YjbR/CyaY superfamily)